MHVEMGQASLFTIKTVIFSGHYLVTIRSYCPVDTSYFSFIIVTIVIASNYTSKNHRITNGSTTEYTIANE